MSRLASAFRVFSIGLDTAGKGQASAAKNQILLQNMSVFGENTLPQFKNVNINLKEHLKAGKVLLSMSFFTKQAVSAIDLC